MQIRQCSGLVMQTLSQRQCNLVTCSSCEDMDSWCLGICGLNSTSTGKIKSKLVNYSISLLTILISFDYCDRIRDLKFCVLGFEWNGFSLQQAWDLFWLEFFHPQSMNLYRRHKTLSQLWKPCK